MKWFQLIAFILAAWLLLGLAVGLLLGPFLALNNQEPQPPRDGNGDDQ